MRSTICTVLFASLKQQQQGAKKTSELLLHPRTRSIHSLAAIYRKHGPAKQVLRLEKTSTPAQVGDDEVLLNMEAAAVSPVDFNIIQNVYGAQAPSLPAVAGIEGVARVALVGKNVKNFAPQMRVVCTDPWLGTWRTHAVVPASSLIRVDETIPTAYAALLPVTLTTAWLLVNSIVNLKRGDVLIQNGATGAVGHAVLQIAKDKGIRTINFLRQEANWKDHAATLQTFGGTGAVVVPYETARTQFYRDAVAEWPKPKLALNCIGGDSATDMARQLADGGTLVTYGAMSHKPVTIPSSTFIFKDIHARGFWLSRELKGKSKEQIAEIYEQITRLIRAKNLELMVETHKLTDLELVVERQFDRSRERKLVLELMH